jgi:uncharacterized protein
MQPPQSGRAGSRSAGPELAGPELASPVLLQQSWADAVFLHWRLPVSAAEPYLPPGVEPDVFEGRTWIGLIGFRVPGTRVGPVLPLPYAGSFTEINVRLYSRGRDGRRGVVFLSMDASRLAFVLAARAGGMPYVWSRCRPTMATGAVPGYGYDVERFRGQGASSFAVRPDLARTAGDELSRWLTARFGLHGRFAGRTAYLPLSHRPWPLHPAALVHCEDSLLAAAGFPVQGPPESVLYSPGVRARFGSPSAVHWT